LADSSLDIGTAMTIPLLEPRDKLASINFAASTGDWTLYGDCQR